MDSIEELIRRLADSVARVESKIDALLMALAEDGEGSHPLLTLDGQASAGERDQSETL